MKKKWPIKQISKLVVATARGLTQFMGKSTRVALLFSQDRNDIDDEILLIDPFDLMVDHKEFLRSAGFASGAWKTGTAGGCEFVYGFAQETFDPAELPGTHFRWFVERGFASARAATFIWCKLAMDAIVGIIKAPNSANFGLVERGLETSSLQVVASVVDSRRGDFPMASTESVIKNLLAISNTREERKAPIGDLIISRAIDAVRPEIQLTSNVSLEEHKLVRKLLTTVQTKPYRLLSIDERIVGFTTRDIGHHLLVASFNHFGNFLTVGQRVAEMRNGTLLAAKEEIDLKKLATPLVKVCGNEQKADACLKAVNELVQLCVEHHAGFSIAITDNTVQGQHLTDRLSIKEHPQLAVNMASVDGALIMRTDSMIEAFGCLLDGPAVPGKELLSRGSRFNSAVRYTNQNSGTALVVVGSEDGFIDAVFCGNPLGDRLTLPDIDLNRVDAVKLTEWFDQNK